MTTTPNESQPRYGTRAAIDAWTQRVDDMLAAASSVPFVTLPRDGGAGIARHSR